MAANFEFRNHYEGGDLIECHSCGVATETIEHLQTPLGGSEKKYFFCSLCFGSLLANACLYPRQYSFVTPVMLGQAMHWLKNEILRELGKP